MNSTTSHSVAGGAENGFADLIDVSRGVVLYGSCMGLYFALAFFWRGYRRGPAFFWRREEVTINTMTTCPTTTTVDDTSAKKAVARSDATESVLALSSAVSLTTTVTTYWTKPIAYRWGEIILHTAPINGIQTIRGAITGAVCFLAIATQALFVTTYFSEDTGGADIVAVLIIVVATMAIMFFIQMLRMTYHLNYLVMVLPRREKTVEELQAEALGLEVSAEEHTKQEMLLQAAMKNEERQAIHQAVADAAAAAAKDAAGKDAARRTLGEKKEETAALVVGTTQQHRHHRHSLPFHRYTVVHPRQGAAPLHQTGVSGCGDLREGEVHAASSVYQPCHYHNDAAPSSRRCTTPQDVSLQASFANDLYTHSLHREHESDKNGVLLDDAAADRCNHQHHHRWCQPRAATPVAPYRGANAAVTSFSLNTELKANSPASMTTTSTTKKTLQQVLLELDAQREAARLQSATVTSSSSSTRDVSVTRSRRDSLASNSSEETGRTLDQTLNPQDIVMEAVHHDSQQQTNVADASTPKPTRRVRISQQSPKIDFQRADDGNAQTHHHRFFAPLDKLFAIPKGFVNTMKLGVSTHRRTSSLSMRSRTPDVRSRSPQQPSSSSLHRHHSSHSRLDEMVLKNMLLAPQAAGVPPPPAAAAATPTATTTTKSEDSDANNSSDFSAKLLAHLKIEEALSSRQHEARLGEVMRLMSANYAVGFRMLLFLLPLVMGMFGEEFLIASTLIVVVMLIGYIDRTIV